jgi:hypothetical protein
MCVAAQARGGTWARLREAPLLLLIGVGLALNNTQAIVRGFGRSKQEFRRTPKFALTERTTAWRSSQYTLPSSGLVPWELLLCALAVVAAARAWDVGLCSLAFWLGLYALSFSTVAGLSLVQADPSTFWGLARRAPARVSKAFRRLGKLLSP